MNILDATTEFARLADLPEGIGLDDYPIRDLREDLLFEEVIEYLDGERHDNPVEIADGLADIIVIAWGSLLTYFGEACARDVCEEVWRSNLSKVDGSLGPITRRGDGKLLKPEGWTGPDVKGVLEKYGHA